MQSVRPSVRLSNAGIVSKRMLMSLHFLTNYKGIILVFFLTTLLKRFRGSPTPLASALKYGRRENLRFLIGPNSLIGSHNRRFQLPMTLSDPGRRNEYTRYDKTWGSACFMVRYVPITRGWASVSTKMFGTGPPTNAHGIRKNIFFKVDQTTYEMKDFTWSITPSALAKNVRHEC